MDYLWSPWRFRYLESAGEPRPSCVFCIGADTSSDRDRLVIHRAAHSFAILNLYPYTSGHFMVAPYAHIDSIAGASPDVLGEIMAVAQRGVAALERLYKPEGFNIGMNLGVAAGAGIREHFHLHVVPRWTGDANFMTVTGETRVLPEEIGVTWRRLSEAF
jgi:ATP adenylyltransferase